MMSSDDEDTFGLAFWRSCIKHLHWLAFDLLYSVLRSRKIG